MAKLKGKRKSGRQKNSTRYNIAKKVRENRRRVRKEAKKMGVRPGGPKRKDPGIPNSWPFKAEMLDELERQKDRKDKELAERRAAAKAKAKEDREALEAESKEAHLEKEADRRKRRAEEAERIRREALRKTLLNADVLIQALDVRDPLNCRCAALEAWAIENGKRLIFVLTKADLVPPRVVTQWLQLLASIAPTIAVASEAGREGVPELLQMLGRAPGAASGGVTVAAEAVGIVGYSKTGKRALSKAMAQEAKGPSRWLLDTLGRLLPVPGPADPARGLHLAIRAAAPATLVTGSAASEGEHIAVVRHFLERTPHPAILRRFRLPAFEGAEGFLTAYCKDRQVKTSKGKDPSLEFVAKRFLAELSDGPGCYCATPEPAAPTGKLEALWQPHAAVQTQLQAVMQAQANLLAPRAESSSTVGGIVVCASGGVAATGPTVNVADAIAGAEADDDISSEDSLDDEEDEEEDFMEDDEEELDDDDSEDDDMDDGEE